MDNLYDNCEQYFGSEGYFLVIPTLMPWYIYIFAAFLRDRVFSYNFSRDRDDQVGTESSVTIGTVCWCC